MKKFLLMTVMALMAIAVKAQQPLVSFHTNAYAEVGEANTFTLVIGGTEKGYIDVDCGFGLVEYELVPAVFDMESQSITGTVITCHVNAAGEVKIYGDEGTRIDYFNGLGCYITDIDFAAPQDLVVLNLDHNLLRELDCSKMKKLQALYVSDNPFDGKPLLIDHNNPNLQILDISIVENIDPAFDISGCDQLRSVDALCTYSLRHLDPTNCPHLVRLSIDNTNVASLDVTQNPELRILNISETAIKSIDLSGNPLLQQFYATHRSSYNSDCKLKSLDFSYNPDLIYIFVSGNELTTLDCSGMLDLRELSASHNYLTSVDIEGCTSLINLDLSYNYLNFNTMPVNGGEYNDYVGNQRPMPMPRSVAVGTPIDMSAAVIRPGTETTASVYSVSRETPDKVSQVSSRYYTYSDGIVTFTSAPSDSVFVVYSNTAFPEFYLETERFKVKTAEDYGKPAKVLAFNPVYLRAGDAVNIAVGIDGASESTPKTVYLDLGDGTLTPFTVTEYNGRATTLDAVKNGYGEVKVYVDGDDVITDLVLEDMYCTAVDLNALTELRHLTLRNLELYDLDTKWNRCLKSMTVTGNHFTNGIDLAGANGWYGKNVLADLNLSNNELVKFGLEDVSMLKSLNLSYNKLTEFNFKDAESLVSLDLSHNEFAEIVLNYCSSLKEAYLTNNRLTSLRLPETNVLERLAIENNSFTYANIPQRGPIPEEGFTYAPQAVIQIPSKGMGINLSSQDIEYDGARTVFTWLTTDGRTLTEGVDYTCEGGNTKFLDPSYGLDVYCEMTHAGYPDFSGNRVLKTSVMNSAGMPQNVLATFVTPRGGEEVTLTMTSTRPAVSVYVDWKGDGDLTQYVLTDETYTNFNAITTEGAEVKVYSYNNVSNVGVFSMRGATLDYIDASGLNQVYCFTVDNAGLKLQDIKFPRERNIRELSLQGNKITSIDLSPFTSLYSLALTNNQLASLDVSKAPKLQTLYVANNRLRKITFDNRDLWGMDLSGNQFEKLDLTPLPSLYQAFLSYNKLNDINVEGLDEMRVLCIDHNCFDFNTLPLRRDNWSIYTYASQAEVHINDGSTVDLSYLSARDGVETVYYWFYGMPYIDSSNGEISGEALVEGEDYTIENGVTTFCREIEEACCVMTNAQFPNMYMITNVIYAAAGVVDVTGDAVTFSVDGLTVSTSEDTDLCLYALDGALVAAGRGSVTAPAAGVYILRIGSRSVKVRLH